MKIAQLQPFNPFARRKAKIVYNFGLSECNRVKVCPLTLKDGKISDGNQYVNSFLKHEYHV